MIDWLFWFYAVSEYSSHVTAGTIIGYDRLWNFGVSLAILRNPFFFEIQRNSLLLAQMGCYPWQGAPFNVPPDVHLFVCLFVWSFSSHSRIFHSFGDVTINGEALQILVYARHSWPLSNKVSLMCHTYTVTRANPL